MYEDLKVSHEPGNPTMGKIFVDLAPFMKMYASYANNYEAAARLMADYRKKKPAFDEFVTAEEANPRCRGLALGSFLIMPVQRIPRYKMLLTELVKYTEEGHPELPELESALDKVGKVAMEINESIRRYEQQQELIELDAAFGHGADIIQPARVLIKQGPLSKICRKSVREYEFFLFNDCVMYADNLQKSTASRAS